MSSKITELREARGLTQSQLAGFIGVSENTIANWEKGGAFDKWIKNLIKLCDTLGCHLQDLDSDFHQGLSPDWNPRMSQAIKDYYEACLNKDKKKISEISGFATQYDPDLRYWLNQANAQYKHEKHDTTFIDSTSLINYLILQSFSQKLSNESANPNKITLEKFKKLIKKLDYLELADVFINRYKDIPKDDYSRKLIFQKDYLCVYMITWKKNHLVKLHHHGYSLDAIKVIDGEMTHWKVSLEQYQERMKSYQKVDNSPIPIPFESFEQAEKYDGESEVFRKDDGWIFIDRRWGHQIENQSNDILITLHVRFGAPPDDDKWSEDEEKITTNQQKDSLIFNIAS